MLLQLKFFEVSHLSFIGKLGQKRKEGMVMKCSGGRHISIGCCGCLGKFHLAGRWKKRYSVSVCLTCCFRNLYLKIYVKLIFDYNAILILNRIGIFRDSILLTFSAFLSLIWEVWCKSVLNCVNLSEICIEVYFWSPNWNAELTFQNNLPRILSLIQIIQ